MEQPLTEEQQKDIEDRVKSFTEKYKALTEEYQVDFLSYPQFIQIGQGVFGTSMNIQLVDKKYTPIPSPLNKND